MPFPHRLLQIGTLSLFAAMIGGLVFYQSGAVKQVPLVVEDSLPPTWSDSGIFHRLLSQVSHPQVWMSSSKVIRVFRPPNTAEKPDSEVIVFSRSDTLLTLDILRMRYEVGRLNFQDALLFDLKRLSERRHEWRMWYSINDPVKDSIRLWEQFKYGPQRVSRLSAKEKLRFQVILNSLPNSGMSQKSRLILRNEHDVAQALKILAAEKWPR